MGRSVSGGRPAGLTGSYVKRAAGKGGERAGRKERKGMGRGGRGQQGSRAAGRAGQGRAGQGRAGQGRGWGVIP